MTALLTTRGGPRTNCQRKRCYEGKGVGYIVEEWGRGQHSRCRNECTNAISKQKVSRDNCGEGSNSHLAYSPSGRKQYHHQLGKVPRERFPSSSISNTIPKLATEELLQPRFITTRFQCLNYDIRSTMTKLHLRTKLAVLRAVMNVLTTSKAANAGFKKHIWERIIA